MDSLERQVRPTSAWCPWGHPHGRTISMSGSATVAGDVLHTLSCTCSLIPYLFRGVSHSGIQQGVWYEPTGRAVRVYERGV